jgi:hypothetical protein
VHIFQQRAISHTAEHRLFQPVLFNFESTPVMDQSHLKCPSSQDTQPCLSSQRILLPSALLGTTAHFGVSLWTFSLTEQNNSFLSWSNVAVTCFCNKMCENDRPLWPQIVIAALVILSIDRWSLFRNSIHTLQCYNDMIRKSSLVHPKSSLVINLRSNSRHLDRPLSHP